MKKHGFKLALRNGISDLDFEDPGAIVPDAAFDIAGENCGQAAAFRIKSKDFADGIPFRTDHLKDEEDMASFSLVNYFFRPSIIRYVSTDRNEVGA